MGKISLPRLKYRSLKQALNLTTVIVLVVSVTAIAFVIFQAVKISTLYNEHKILSDLTVDLAYSTVHSDQVLTSLKANRSANYNELAEALIAPLSSLYQDRDNIQKDLENIPINDLSLRKDLSSALESVNAILGISSDILQMSRDPNVTAASLKTRYDLLAYKQSLLEANLKVALTHTSKREAYIRKHLDKAFKNTIRFLIGAIIILLFLELTAYYHVNRYVITPLVEFTNSIKKIPEDSLEVRLPLKRDDEIGALAKAFQQLILRVQEARRRLTTLVEERTKALQRRTAQIQTATEVGRAVATERNLNQLLPLAARLIAQRYGYYHVGIFLTSSSGDYAEVEAVYSQDSEIAERMLKEKLRLAVGVEGLVGRAIGSGKVQTAQTMSAENRTAYKHILPETNAAAALPMKVGDEILGAIDVQCKREEAFPPEDITALQAVTDQLAVAIQNLRLLQETQEALEAAQRAYAQVSAKGWESFLTRRRVVGYRLLENGALQPTMAKTPSTSPKRKEGEPKQAPLASPQDANTLQIPIQVRGVTVAKAKLVKATPWTKTEKQVVERLSERVGLALESARLYAEAQRRAAQLQIAAEIAREANSTLDLETLLERAVNLVHERFQFYHASIFLRDETGHYMVVRASTGEAGKQMLAHHHRLAIGSASVVGQTAATGKPVVINDVSKSEIHHFNPLLPNTSAEMGIPLRAGDEIIGVLDVQSEMLNAFTEDDVRILQILADQLAVAVINAELFAETQRNIEHHRVLHQITTAAASATSIESAIQNTVERLSEAAPGNFIAVLTVDAKNPEILRVAAWGGVDKEIIEKAKDIEIPIGQGATGKAASSGEVIIVPDTTQMPDYIAIVPGMRSEIAVPITYRGRLLGVLNLENPQVQAYSETERELLVTLANSLGAIWANINLLEQVRRHSKDLEILYEITAAASSQVDLPSLLEILTSKLQEKLDLLHCGVVLFDPNGKTGTLVASASAPDAPGKDMVGVKLPLSSPLIVEARSTGKPSICRNVDEDERVADIRHLLHKRGTKQLIVVPLMTRDEIIGTLGLDIGTLERQITEDELRLLEQIAHQIATSVEVARLFNQAVRTAEREHLLAEITSKLRATNDPTVIIQTAVEEMKRALKAKTAQLLITDTGPTQE